MALQGSHADYQVLSNPLFSSCRSGLRGSSYWWHIILVTFFMRRDVRGVIFQIILYNHKSLLIQWLYRMFVEWLITFFLLAEDSMAFGDHLSCNYSDHSKLRARDPEVSQWWSVTFCSTEQRRWKEWGCTSLVDKHKSLLDTLTAPYIAQLSQWFSLTDKRPDLGRDVQGPSNSVVC